MLVGSLAITLNLMSVALLAFFIGVVVLSVSAPLCFSKLSHFTFRIRKLALWLLATGPWWIGAICVAIFAFGYLWTYIREFFCCYGCGGCCIY